MRYLKSYKLFENIREEHIQVLKDILLELKDEGYVIEFDQSFNNTPSMREDIYIRIYKEGHREKDELAESVVRRMQDYMSEYGYGSKVFRSERAPYMVDNELSIKDTFTNIDVRFGLKGQGYFKD